MNEEKGICGSVGYDANSGFYHRSECMMDVNTEYWVEFPEWAQERLRRLTTMEVSFWKRLKFLITNK
jgi:hypothetical protein